MPDRKTDKGLIANVGYARVSTSDQDPALKLDALAAAGCAKLFEDRASGVRAGRVGLRATLGYVREGDVLVVWKLDRLGRSLPNLIETVVVLEKRVVGFRSITEAVDTTTSSGRLVFHLFGALANSSVSLSRNPLERGSPLRRPAGGRVAVSPSSPERNSSERAPSWARV